MTLACQPEVPNRELSQCGTPAQYPFAYATEFDANNGMHFTVRPILPSDEPLMVAFHRHLSEQTVYRRYFSPLRLDIRVSHERLLKQCLVDYHNQLALVAIHTGDAGQEIAGVARLIKIADAVAAEVAFVIADHHQHHGLGTYLLKRTIEIARSQGFTELEAVVLAENLNMKDLLRRVGFRFQPQEGIEVTARLALR